MVTPPTEDVRPEDLRVRDDCFAEVGPREEGDV